MHFIFRALLPPVFLLSLVFFGYRTYVDWQLSQPFIRPIKTDEGDLGFHEDPRDVFSPTTFYPHQLAPPFLIVDFSCYSGMFEFWNPHPDIKSINGYSLSSNEFSTPDQPFSWLYQDTHYDSLQLTFSSFFGDSVTITERNLPQGKVCMNTQKLDQLAGYIRGDIPHRVDSGQEIIIIMEWLGCFGGTTRSISWSPDKRLLLRYQEYGMNTTITASYNFYEEAIEAIVQAQSTSLSIEEMGQTIVSIKVGPNVQQLFGGENDLESIHQLFSDILEFNSLEKHIR